MSTKNVLVVAAHPDDEVLGCGGTIARHVAEGDNVRVIFLADGESARGGDDAAIKRRKEMAESASLVLGTQHPTFLYMADQQLDTLPFLSIVKEIELDKNWPDIIYTHHAGDLNMDHRIVHQAVMTAFRPLPDAKYTAIYAFEVPSSTEWGSGFEPDHFVDITRFADKRLAALRAYGDEIKDNPAHPRSLASIISHNHIRGTQSGLRCAEAFMTMRTIRR